MINAPKISNMGEIVRKMVLGAEGANLTRPTNVGDHTVTYGYGYTFIQRGTDGKWSLSKSLDSDLDAIGITLIEAEHEQLLLIVKALNQNNLTLADQLIVQFKQAWRYVDLTDSEAQTLYDQVIGHKGG